MINVKELARRYYKEHGYYVALQFLKSYKVLHIAYNILLEIKQEELNFEELSKELEV